MAGKMKKCSTCGADIASNAKVCPQCGAKNKKPIYKKWWFYVIVILVVGGIASGANNSQQVSTSNIATSAAFASPNSVSTESASSNVAEVVEYTHYDVTELFDALDENALKASNAFKDQYVEIEGYLGTIDSNGKYICVEASSDNYDYFLQSVQCYINGQDQLNQIMEMSAGDAIVVRGKITSVGEVLGYSMKIDSIN